MADLHKANLTSAELNPALAKAAALPGGTVATEDFVREQLKDLEIPSGLPEATEADNGKFLMVVGGVPAWVALTNVAEEGA